MENNSYRKIILKCALSIVLKELRFPCAIFSPESKFPSKEHQTCTDSPIEPRPHFTYFNKKEKTEPFFYHRQGLGNGPILKTEPFLNQLTVQFGRLAEKILIHFNRKPKIEPFLNHLSLFTLSKFREIRVNSWQGLFNAL